MKPIRVKKRELPVPVFVEGDQGEVEVYQLSPAGKGKIGAFLQKVTSPVREMLLHLRPNK